MPFQIQSQERLKTHDDEIERFREMIEDKFDFNKMKQDIGIELTMSNFHSRKGSAISKIEISQVEVLQKIIKTPVLTEEQCKELVRVLQAKVDKEAKSFYSNQNLPIDFTKHVNLDFIESTLAAFV